MMASIDTPMSEPEGGFLELPTPDGKGTVKYEYLSPTAEQLAMFVAVASQGAALQDKLYALLEFLEDVLANERDLHTIRRRLRDRNDALTIEALFAPITEIVTGQTGFPTEPQPGSSPSRSTTGKRSTGRIQPGE